MFNTQNNRVDKLQRDLLNAQEFAREKMKENADLKATLIERDAQLRDIMHDYTSDTEYYEDKISKLKKKIEHVIVHY